MNIKWVGVIIFLMFLILIHIWIGFIALDMKINKEIERQVEINKVSCEINNKQSQEIRMLQTDTNILLNIAVNQDYCEEKK